jgi:ATP-dependent RNA circularization protein (DNA/RNA ligase family)
VRVHEFNAVTKWCVEEKLDGQNIRIHVKRPGPDVPPVATFNGRTDNAQLSGPVRALCQQIASLSESALLCPTLYHDEVTLYGEAIGPKIQKNPHGLPETQFVLFDVAVAVDAEHFYWAPREEVEIWAGALGVNMPPRLEETTLERIIDRVREGFSSLYPNGAQPQAEGVICRPSYELVTQRGQRVIWKLKTKDF